MRSRFRRFIPFLLILGLVAAAWWYFRSGQTIDLSWLKEDQLPAANTASGTIEAVQVLVAPETGGQVVEVTVEEGQTVTAGQVLVRFSDSLLQAQLAQAQAALAQARANYELVAAGVAVEQRQAAVAAAEYEIVAARQAMDELNKTADLAKARAEQAVAVAEKALDRATQRLDSIQGDADQADIDAAEAAVVLAKDRLDKARKDFKPYENKSPDNVIRAMLQSKLAAAQRAYDQAVTRLNNLLAEANRYDLALAKADKALAEAQLAEARRQLDKVKSGPDPDALELARKRLQAAQARLTAAQAEPTAEQLAVARAQVEVAQAAVGLIQAQMEKLVIKAPMSGVVLSRAVEPGEVVMPGATLLTLARLDSLKITVYLPEDRYGTINLGQRASVTVDSFPGVVFPATVVYIADQAEYTPRNVQTAEGRRTTVFAIRLAVQNSDGRLKPGMPADVNFER